jgi:hypothetical protein
MDFPVPLSAELGVSKSGTNYDHGTIRPADLPDLQAHYN